VPGGAAAVGTLSPVPLPPPSGPGGAAEGSPGCQPGEGGTLKKPEPRTGRKVGTRSSFGAHVNFLRAPPRLSKWEKGETALRAVNVPFLAKALGCSLEQLQNEIWKSSRERLGSPEEPQSDSEARPERRALEERERMIRSVDREADDLRGLADILRQDRTMLASATAQWRKGFPSLAWPLMRQFL
jgi:hypothetical protein